MLLEIRDGTIEAMKILTILIFALSSTWVFAKTLLVTDIDDTIKVSHVLDFDSLAANAVATKNAFMGMPELYQSLVKIPDASQMHYLSNAPKKLMTYFHEKFVRINNFPEGVLVLRQKISDQDHKIKSLREMIKKHNPTKMILIGDNGEKDPVVYAKIRAEFPEIGGETYIHLVYSSLGFEGQFAQPLHPGQIPWVTSLDLALDLVQKGYLDQSDYETVVASTQKRALLENPMVKRNRQMMFPAWLDCRDAKIPQLPEILPELQKKIENRCSRPPLDN